LIRIGVAGLLALFAIACASTATTTATTATMTATTTNTVAAKDEWSTQSFVEKHETMTFVVLPNMARSFAKFRGDKVPKLRCVSCHGENAEQVKYRMPNDSVRALDPNQMPGVDDGPWPKFMIEEVMPAMKQMTGDPNLTCFSCHARATP